MHKPLRPPKSKHLGFSLIELMIAMVVIAILASLAYPSLMGSIRKGRRAEAFNALTAVQQAQERWRGSNAGYATDLTPAPNAVPTPGLGLSATTPGSLYSISLANVNAGGNNNTYEVIATAVSGSSQVNDGDCAKLAVKMDGGRLTYAGASSSGSLTYGGTSPCWNR